MGIFVTPTGFRPPRCYLNKVPQPITQSAFRDPLPQDLAEIGTASAILLHGRVRTFEFSSRLTVARRVQLFVLSVMKSTVLDLVPTGLDGGLVLLHRFWVAAEPSVDNGVDRPAQCLAGAVDASGCHLQVRHRGLALQMVLGALANA